jgi:hypothetical protein
MGFLLISIDQVIIQILGALGIRVITGGSCSAANAHQTTTSRTDELGRSKSKKSPI